MGYTGLFLSRWAQIGCKSTPERVPRSVIGYLAGMLYIIVVCLCLRGVVVPLHVLNHSGILENVISHDRRIKVRNSTCLSPLGNDAPVEID